MVTPNYVQAQVLAVEGEGATDVAAGDANNDANPMGNQGTTPTGMYNPNVCWRCGQVGTLQEIVLLRTLNQPKLWAGCIIHWKQKPP